MSVLTPVRPVVTPDEAYALTTLMAEPEAPVSDPPLAVPQAAFILLAALLLLISPATPKEPRK